MTVVPPPVVTADELRTAIGDGSTVVVEVSRGGTAPTPGDGARIPGAHAVDLAELTGVVRPGTGATPLPDAVQVRALVERWGVHDASTVVVATADHPSTATRAWWVLRWAGLADVRFLDGGRAAWVAAGGALTTERPAEGGGTATVTLGALPTVGSDTAADAARRGRLVDARGAEAHAGTPDDGDGARTGHVPGAVSLPAAGALRGGGLADEPTLRARYAPYLDTAPAGEAPLVASCGSGVAATVDVLALAVLGVTVPLYPGSFTGWVSEGRPVAKGA
ncbi:sulfurtransferase [Isoptericola sp. NPDC058082]|uniref:sulfurtransferase n=1 Tax=Isoptericola sp. NPDC058082 TaxID=3346331 RepID=UPI0036E02D25